MTFGRWVQGGGVATDEFGFYETVDVAAADRQSPDSLSGLHAAVAQRVSPHLMVTFSDYGNMLGQLYANYGLVGVGEDQAMATLGVPVFTHGPPGFAGSGDGGGD